MSTWSAPGLAADSSTRKARSAARSSARPACICGWRRMPMRFGSTATCPATRWPSRCPACMRRCSRTWRRRSTSTGCSIWRAASSKQEGVERSRGDLLKDLDDRILAVPPASVLYHPYISQAGERGPFVDPRRARCSSGLDVTTGFDNLMRGVFEGLCFAARDCYSAMGDIPQGGADHRRCCALPGPAHDAGKRARRGCSHRDARGGGRCRCGDDGGRPAEDIC